MARLKNGILGGISGKINDVIGYMRYGKAFVKMKSIKPVQERKPGQLEGQQRMAVVNGFINTMTEFVRIGFSLDAAKKTHSANAAAKSYQMKNTVCLFLKLPYKNRTNHLTLYYYGKTEKR